MMQRIVPVLIAILSAGFANGQLAVSTAMTPEELVQDVLLGGGITASNITYTGNPLARGSFTAVNSNLGLDGGLILSSGLAADAANPASFFASTGHDWNPTPDPDLEQISGFEVFDKSVLEFDFVPTGDTLRFRYVFGSQEYPNYTCSSVNDAFGFFLSGPGINGPFTNNAINIALVPGTQVPISINTVNSGNNPDGGGYCQDADPNWQANSVYFVDNSFGTTVAYEGFTVVLTAFAVVTCGETYHIKLAIADAGDSILDSAVFLEGGSFTSVPFVPTLNPGPMVSGNTIYESCLPVTMEIQRTSCDLSLEETVYFNFGGTATMGEDIVPAFPDSLVFDADVASISIEFFVPIDPDGPETWIIEMITIDSEGVVATATFLFLIDQGPPLELTGYTETIDCGQAVEFEAVVSGGFAEYAYAWSNGDTTPVMSDMPIEDTTYSVLVTDACGETVQANYQVIITPPLPLTMLILGPSTVMEGCDGTQINILRPQGTEGDILVNLVITGAENNVDVILPGSVTIPAGSFNILVPFEPLEDGVDEGEETALITGTYTDDCGRTVSASVSITIIDAPEIFISGNDYAIDCNVDTLMISVDAYGGVGDQLTITWGSQGELTGPDVWIPVQTSGTYPVTATDACGRTATTTVNVIVDCEVIIPNVFTPNGDSYNDIWEIEGILYTTNTLRVFNRWGQIIYETQNYRNTWRAAGIPDGTYFYEITVDRHEKPYTGHLTILRN